MGRIPGDIGTVQPADQSDQPLGEEFLQRGGHFFFPFVADQPIELAEVDPNAVGLV